MNVVESINDARGSVRGQPCDIEGEAALLGCCLIKPDVLPTLTGITQLSFFSRPHALIYEAVVDCYAKSSTVDVVGVSTWLRERSLLDDAGGAGYVTEIITSTPVFSARRIAQIVESVTGKQRLREVITQCDGIIAECRRGRDESLATVRESMLPVLLGSVAAERGGAGKEPVLAFECANSTYEQLLAGDGPTGISTGIRGIDQLTGGLYGKEVTIIAARPGFGKTAIAGTILSNCASAGHPCLFFSLEMGTESIINRLVCSRAGIDASKPRSRTMDSADMEAYRIAVDRMTDWPLWIDDRSRITVEQMIDTCHNHNRLLARSGKRLRVVAIDYAQLVLAKLNKDANSESQLSHISSMVKSLSKEIDVSVILLSQLNRSSESDGREDPRMSDLRGSGALEQDADQIAFLCPLEAPNEHAPQRVNLIFKKSRNSTVGEVPLIFQRKYCSYSEV